MIMNRPLSESCAGTVLSRISKLPLSRTESMTVCAASGIFSVGNSYSLSCTLESLYWYVYL